MRRPFVNVVLSCASAALVGSIPGGAAAQAADPTAVTTVAVPLSALAAGAEQRNPAVAFDGTSHLLVWEENWRIWGARLDVGGAVAQGRFEIAPIAAPGAVRATPAVAALAPDGPFLVVWAEEAGTETGWDIRGARVSASGAVLDDGGFDVSTVLDVDGVPTTAPGSQERPTIATSGNEFLVVWQDGRDDPVAPDIFGAALDAGGNVVPSGRIAISQEATEQRSPSVASNGSGYLVVWDDGPPGGPYDIFGTRVDATSWVADPDYVISAAEGDQVGPTVASDGTGYLVAWNDQRAGGWRLGAARMDGAGAVVDGAVTLAALDGATPHAIASGGSGWLITFQRGVSGALVVRLGASGGAGLEATIDATGVMPPGQALAFGGMGRYLAVHREDVSGVPQLAGTLVTTLEPLVVTPAGTGTGTVTSTPPGIDCGATCAAEFETGSEVLLSAEAAPGSTFASWLGCAATGTTCTVTMSAPAAATATFSLDVPGAPGMPTYASVAATSLTVSWSEAANATSYRLERAPDSPGGPGPWIEIAVGIVGTSHGDTGLTGSTTYWYRVRGTNGGGDGPTSGASSVTTALAPPDAPAGPTFSDVTASSLTATWTAPAGCADGCSYDLERGAGASGPWTPIATGVTALSAPDAGPLGAGTIYWYRVRAANAAGPGPYSAASQVITVAGPPGMPTFSGITTTSLIASWDAPAGASSYEVERAPDDGAGAPGPWEQIASGIAGTSHPVVGLASNTPYWFRVRATNASGAGGYSTAARVSTLPDAPGGPSFAGVAETTLTVSWTAPPGGTATYDLDRATGAAGPWTPLATGTTALTRDDSGLTPGTTYWYQVRAVNSDGRAGAYATATVVTAPGAPPAPTFSAIGPSSVTVSWSVVPSATSYELERGESSGGPWTPVVIDPAATSHVDATLLDNTSYWYRVRASNGSGAGAFSASSSVTTVPAAPGAPVFGAVTASSVTVSWSAPVRGAASYRLERAPDAGGAPGTWAQIAGGIAATTYDDTGLTGNGRYWYRVRATNATGDGPFSPEGGVLTLAAAAAAPTFGAVLETSLVVSWMAPAGGAASYDVERGTSATGPWSTVATSVAVTSAPDSGLVAGTTYWYRVLARNADGAAGAWSAPASVATLPAATAAPTFADVGATSVSVDWAAVTGATSYKVERGSSSAGPWAELASGLTATTYPSTGLTSNAQYWYRVRATNGSGDGAYSPASTVVTLPAAPGTPTFGSVTTTSVSVTWTAPSGGATSYDLERGASATGPWTVVATAIMALTAPDGGLAVGTTYWYRVRGVNPSGAGAYSAAAQVITLPDAPGAPAFTNLGATSVTVSWGAATGAASYEIERALDDGAGAPGAWAQVVAGVTGTTYDSAGLAANTRYWYRIQARNAWGEGAYSPETSVVTLPAPPGTPTFSSVTTASLVVSWTAPANGAASYDLERGTSASGPWTSLAVATTALTFADSGLAAGTTYWYRVRATNSDGLSSGWAVGSAPTLPIAPPAPTFTSVGTVSLTVRWESVPGATTYKLERTVDDGSGAPSSAWTQIASQAGTTFADSALAPNTTYWYRIRAWNVSGDGEYSPPSSVMTLPGAPGKPSFASVTTTSLTVSWTAPAGGASSYELERATSALGPWTQVATGITALGLDDSGLTAGTMYFYRVRAVNAAGGAGGWSPIASVQTVPGAPGAPTYSGISPLSLTVHWTAMLGATEYHVERAPDVSGAPGDWVPVAEGLSGTSYNDVTTPNTTYWYRVRGWNSSGYGVYSPASQVTTVAGAPGAPTFSNVTSTGVTVSWTAPAGGAESYVVERAMAAIGPWTSVASGVAVLTYDDTGLSPQTQYWYRIRATNAAGGSASSSIAAVTTLPAAPAGAPGAPVFGAIGTTSVAVSWTDATGASSWQLERAPDAGGVPGTWTAIATVAVRSYTDGGLTANTAYWYRVHGSTAGGYGPYSGESGVVTLPNAPGTPAFTSVATTSVTVSWTAPAGGAASYELERGTSAAGPWSAPFAAPAPGATIAGLDAGTTYWFRVRATNSAGAAGAWSPSASVTTLTAAPGAPGYVNVGTTAVTVVWTAASGAVSYRLERGTDAGGPWTQVGGAIAGTSWIDATAANTTYWYRVWAVNAAGADGASSPATSITTLPGAPGAPTFTAVAAESLSLSWTPPSGGAASYEIERATSAGGPWIQRATGVTAFAWADAGLAPNTTYHYRVRGTNVLGRDGPWSASAFVTTAPDGTAPPVGTPAAPVFSSVAVTSLRVAWSAVAGASTYQLERAPDAGGVPATWTLVASTASLAYFESGRTANTRYWYRVRASGSGGSSQGPAASVITAPNAPGAPAFTSVAVTTLVVSWAAPVGGAASYDLERATSAAGPWTRIATAIATTSRGDSGLVGGTTYHYRVRAINAAGVYGYFSAARSVTTLPDPATPVPDAPGAPTFTSILASSVKVSWAPAAGATSYKLERAAASSGPWTQIAAIAATSFTDTGRSGNTAYWYRVRGFNGATHGAYSAVSAVTTAPNTPGAPTFSSVGSTQLTVSWAAPYGGAASYEVDRALSAAGPWTQIGSGIAGLTYASTGLAGYTTYYYRVRGTNSAGVDGFSSPARAVTTLVDSSVAPPGAPGAPTYPIIASSYLKVSWTAATGAASYRLERAAASSGPWTQIAAPTATSFTDTGRSPNTAYWYRVRGSNASGDGAYSPDTVVVTAPNPPGAPTFASVSATSVSITWTAPSGGAATYVVERASGAYGPWLRVAAGIPTTGHADTGLTGYTTFYYRVRGTNAQGRDGTPSATRSVTLAADGSIAVPGPPGAPTFPSVSTTWLRVSWTAAVGATRYELDRATASTGPWTRVVTTTGTSYSDTGRAPNTRYWYRVRGSNIAGPGADSDVRGAMTLPNAPGAPTFTSVGTDQLTVSWTAPSGGAASYTVERAGSASGPWTQIASGLTSLSHADAGLAPGTSYSYRVRGMNADGAGGSYSATRSVATESAPPGF